MKGLVSEMVRHPGWELSTLGDFVCCIVSLWPECHHTWPAGNVAPGKCFLRHRQGETPRTCYPDYCVRREASRHPAGLDLHLPFLRKGCWIDLVGPTGD